MSSESPVPKIELTPLNQLVEHFASIRKAEVAADLEVDLKDRETEKMQAEYAFKLQEKTLDNERMRDQEDAQERDKIRKWVLIVFALIILLCGVAVWRGQGATALELIKLLAALIGPIVGAYSYGKYRSQRERSGKQISKE